MSATDLDITKIVQTIRDFDRQIEEMHLNVQRYLSDRSRYPHPRHEELIQTINFFEVKGLRVRSVELMIENVQFKATNRARIWKQWFEDDAKGLYRRAKVDSDDREVETISDPRLDKIYERAKEAWKRFGVSDIESKNDFIKRILPSYNEARRNLKKDQRIAFTYDKNSNRVLLKVLKKE
jgi:bisphosphoglycerate-dependent phosphoglycerate mutase